MDILEKTLFPFSRIREEQERMVTDVVTAVEEGKVIISHAPTGIGKTAATLAPALAYALENGKTLFFLTPKHSQHHIAVETLKKIKKKYKKKIVSIDLIGKQWTCLYDGARELNHTEFTYFCQSHRRNETCRFCNNVTDPANKKMSDDAKLVMEKIKKKGPLHAEEIADLCKDSELCAYEVNTILARKANVIIGDYYHLFHPHVRQALLTKMDKSLEDLIIIVDEAHNLPNRVRNLMSYNLNEFVINNAVKEARALREGNLEEDLEALSRVIKKYGKKLKENEMFVDKEEFSKNVEKAVMMKIPAFIEDLELFGEKVLELPNRYRSYCMSIASFFYDWTDPSRNEATYARIFNTYMSNTGRRFQLSTKCLDPALYTEEVFSRAHSSILMSGTLLPTEMYENILGLHNPMIGQYENPFPKENRIIIMTHGMTTKFSHRTEHMWNKIALSVSKIINEVPGNTAVFFPSYKILETIGERLKVKDKELLFEKKEMNKSQRYALYARLSDLADGNGGVLLAVQAGSFSEGMDFPGKMLDCAIVVGLPLERPTLETDALIKYYDFKFNRGWDFGYIYPAMNRALQAAGRCIRSETDRGAIILMDDRFKWRNYRRCFPKDMKFIVTEKPEMYLAKFFKI